MSYSIRPLCLIAAALAVALVVIPARAGCNAVTYAAPAYVQHAKAVHHDDYHAKKVTVLEYVPLYAVGYAPAAPVAASPAKSPCDEKIDNLRAEMERLKSSVQAPAPLPLSAPPKMSRVTDDPIAAGAAVLQSRCASCHTGATSKKDIDGNPFVIFTEPGQLNPAAAVLQMLLAVEDDHMPPSKPLAADEKAALRALVRTLARK